MGVFDDNPFVSVKPGHAPKPAVADADEVARGSFWTLHSRSGRPVLTYVSGELAGREQEVVISDEEAHSLYGGDDKAAQAVLLAHGVG